MTEKFHQGPIMEAFQSLKEQGAIPADASFQVVLGLTFAEARRKKHLRDAIKWRDELRQQNGDPVKKS